MTEVSFWPIPGVMLGIELVDADEYEDVNWGFVIDLLILRIIVMNRD